MAHDDRLDNFVSRGLNAQRAVDRIIENHNAPDSGPSPHQDVANQGHIKKRNLANPINVHWRTDAEGFEYIMRTVFEMKDVVSNLIEAERRLWFTRGWKKRLDKMRSQHRKAGISDSQFIHSSVKK